MRRRHDATDFLIIIAPVASIAVLFAVLIFR
jgi:hypothetical protein